MKVKNVMKILVAILLVVLVLSFSTMSFAKADDTYLGPDTVKATQSNAADSLQDFAGTIYGIAQVIGISVAVIMLIILAIKYLSAAPAEKAEIKKSALIYVVGALLLFGGVAFLNIIKDAGAKLEQDTAHVEIVRMA